MSEGILLWVALSILCIVSIVAFARLVVVAKIFRRQRRSGHDAVVDDGAADAGESNILVPSLLFHALVFLCLATVLPVYAYRCYAVTMQKTSEVQVGPNLFALHLCSYPLLVSAFCVIVTLWSDVAVFEPNNWSKFVSRSMVVLCGCYLLVTVMAVCVCLALRKSVKHFFSSVAFMLFCAYSSSHPLPLHWAIHLVGRSIAALLLLGICFLILGCMLQRRICRVLFRGSCTARLTARVVRLNVVMLACFICFTLRALMLAALVEEQAEGEIDNNPSQGWHKWQWDLRFEWIPHVIPCIAMLYLMRRAGHPPSQVENNGNENAEMARQPITQYTEDGKSEKNSYGSYS